MRRRRASAKREIGDALVIKTEESKYLDVLKAMWSDAKLVNLGADVHSTGELILEFKRDKERKGAVFKGLGVAMRALTAEATLKMKNLDEISDVE